MMRPTRPRIILSFSLAALLSAATALAHPGSGIVVDRRGQVYFVDTGQGVWRIDPQGRLAPHEGPAFHWMAIDAEGRFAATRLPSFPSAEVRAVGSDPTLILSSDFPLVVGGDGNLYYPEPQGNGPLQVTRLAPAGARSVLATLPAEAVSGSLRWLNGMASGPEGAIYYTETRAVRKISREGSISTIAESVSVPDCALIPGAEPELGPYLRGLDVRPDGTVFVAAAGCGAVLRIPPGGDPTPVLRSTSPWSPTAVAVAGESVYVLEYLHTASDERGEWIPRVRRIAPDGKAAEVAAVERR